MRAAFLLLGAFAFAYNLAIGLHELGHAIVARLTGGRVLQVNLHPFGTSSVEIDPDPFPIATLAGGILLGPALASSAAALAWRSRRSPALHVHMTAVASLGTTGTYLAVGSLAGMGDAGDLIGLGVPAAALLATGLLALSASMGLAATVLPMAGLGRDVTLLRRIATLELAVLPYFAAVLAYNARYESSAISNWIALLAAGAAATGVAALLSHALRSQPLLLERERPGSPSTADVLYSLGLGVGIILLGLLAS